MMMGQASGLPPLKIRPPATAMGPSDLECQVGLVPKSRLRWDDSFGSRRGTVQYQIAESFQSPAISKVQHFVFGSLTRHG